jgi:hypothetical protein
MIELTNSRGFVLSGYEIQPLDGGTERREQAWLVRTLSGRCQPDTPRRSAGSCSTRAITRSGTP